MFAFRPVPVALILVLAGCGAATDPDGKPGAAKPSPAKEGVEWTHKELLEYLKSQALDTTSAPVALGKSPAVALKQNGSDKWAIVALMQTAQEAREIAGSRGESGYAWGRFFFLSEQPESSLIPEIKQMLSH